MRDALGDGYVEALRGAWSDVPESADFVMFWWHHAAELTRAGQLRQFGLITTNSLRQSFNRRILETHLNAKNPLSLVFAIPDHPWVDAAEGADVRIAMTVACSSRISGKLSTIVIEEALTEEDISIVFSDKKGILQSDLRIGANVHGACILASNESLAVQGVILVGEGFRLTRSEALTLKYSVPCQEVRPYLIGRDIVQRAEERYVIDLNDYEANDAMKAHPRLMNVLLQKVKPDRDANKDKQFREQWWRWGRRRPDFFAATKNISRFIATCRTAKHRIFLFVDVLTVPDTKLIAIALDNPFYLGILSSEVHKTWALATGAMLGIGNDPTYNHSESFTKFPFPVATEQQQAKISALAEQLDAHRKKQQAQHPELTLTGMYNVLEKLKSGETLNAKEKTIHEQGLVSVLKQLHDELDLAVLDAYGWNDLAEPMQIVNGNVGARHAVPLQKHAVPEQNRATIKRALDETLLERLVALNSERAEEEKRGIVRWLRPEFQNSQGNAATQTIAVQTTMDVETDIGEPVVTAIEKQPWPKADIEQVKAVIDVLAASKTPIDLDAIAAHFSGKGAWKKRLPSILEMLVVVGKVRVDDGKFGGV